MSTQLRNEIIRIVEALLGQIPVPRRGVVASVNPANMTARVNLPSATDPSGFQLTGWLPIVSPCMGAGWGVVAAPPVGSQVIVMPMEGDGDASVLWGAHWSNPQRPPAGYTVGEIWAFHETGAFLKVNNAGGAVLQDQMGAVVTAQGNGTVLAQDKIGSSLYMDNAGTIKMADSAGTIYSLNGGTATLTGNLVVSGTVSANDLIIPSLGKYTLHIHGVTGAPGETGVPMS